MNDAPDEMTDGELARWHYEHRDELDAEEGESVEGEISSNMSVTMSFRLPGAEADAIREAADSEGLSLSEWIRRACSAAHRHSPMGIARERSQRYVLDDPTEPSDADDLRLTTRCFLSYSRVDNKTFDGVVDELHQDLAGLYEAATGERLEVFLDRESIGWGQDWREEIRRSVLGATLFIPVVTMRYFNSPACLEELLAFHAQAQNLGVSELILPIVLAGEDELRSGRHDEAVQLIESLNYKHLGPAWRSGYESSDWRKAMTELVDELRDALDRAETRLATASPADIGHAASPAEAEGSTPPTEEVDISALAEQTELISALMDDVTTALEVFTVTAEQQIGSEDLPGLSPGQMNARLLRAAAELRPSSQELGRVGTTLQKEVATFDAHLRATIQELAGIGHPVSNQTLTDLVRSLTSDYHEVSEAMSQVDEFIQMLKLVAMMNASLRKTLHPAIAGLTGLKAATTTVSSWAELSARIPSGSSM